MLLWWLTVNELFKNFLVTKDLKGSLPYSKEPYKSSSHRNLILGAVFNIIRSAMIL